MFGRGVGSVRGIIVLRWPIIESIPNVSEGRRPEVVERMAAAIRGTPGVRLLDIRRTRRTTARSSRSSATRRRSRRRRWRCSSRAVAAIDLRSHQGEHPRLGAVDVVPFVPIEGATMADCVALAKDVAATVAERFALPVYLYEDAATDPARRNLEDIRRGEFEGLAREDGTPGWAPDFGPAQPHESAGAARHRRADAADRLQHQPQHRPARRRKEDRRRRSATAAAACASSRRWG